jgi:hypothetical protein
LAVVLGCWHSGGVVAVSAVVLADMTLTDTITTLGAAIAIACFVVYAAYGHDHWISRGVYRDPVHKWHCCGEDDCKPLREDEVQYRKDGYLIKATGELVPFNRVIPSEPDSDQQARFWVCRWGHSETLDSGSVVEMLRCFFAPVGGV